jgi:hypothetical protein
MPSSRNREVVLALVGQVLQAHFCAVIRGHPRENRLYPLAAQKRLVNPALSDMPENDFRTHASTISKCNFLNAVSKITCRLKPEIILNPSLYSRSLIMKEEKISNPKKMVARALGALSIMIVSLSGAKCLGNVMRASDCLNKNDKEACRDSFTKVLMQDDTKAIIESRGYTKAQAKIYAGYRAETIFPAYDFKNEECNQHKSGHGSANTTSAHYSEESYLVCSFEATRK